MMQTALEPQRDREFRVRWLIAAGLFLVTLGLYLPALRFDFVNFDDPQYVYENDVVHQGLTWRGLVWAFARGHAGNWHPLTWLSHMLDCQLFGLNAGGHHATNVLLHALTGTLLFVLLEQLTTARWRSAFVAALFLWHPMHVESVAWVSERKDVLSALLFVLTLLAYVHFVREESTPERSGRALKPYWLSIGLFAIGLLAKSMLVTLPFVLLLLDFWPLRRDATKRWSDLVREKVPYFVLAAVFSAITFYAQKTQGAVAALDRMGFAPRIANVLISYARYLQKLFWPSDLIFYYRLPKVIPWDMAVPSVLLLMLLTLAVLAGVRKMSWLASGWFWFIGMLVPVIGLVQVGRQAMADRYSYLPSIGLFVAATWTVWMLCQRTRRAFWFASFLAITALAGYAALAHRQISYWRDSAALTDHALDVDPENFPALQNLALYWFRHDRNDLAIELYRRADELHPNDAGGLNGLGWALIKAGKTAEAQETFRRVLQANPNDAQALCTLGTFAVRDGKIAEGLPQLEKAVTLRPSVPDYRYELAHALVVAGRLPDALNEYRKTLQHDPDFVPALKELAWLLATCPFDEMRNGPDAVKLAERACANTRYNDPHCLNVLDAAYAEAGRFQDAIATAEKARTLYLNSGDTKSAALIPQRVSLYQNHRPFRTGGK